MQTVLVLSEDDTTSGLLGLILQRECFLPVLTSSRDTALQKIFALDPSLIVLDVPFGGVPAVELCSYLRMCQVTKPMIMLGDSAEEFDKVLALEAGADDYVVKPIPDRELVARMRALIRRCKANANPVTRFGNVEVDTQHRAVTCRGQDIKMTPCEYKLLLFFLSNVDLALTRQTILSSVWRYSEDVHTRTLDAHIYKLRNKCEEDPSSPRHFVTVHGVGYRFLA
jgi:DNA-binding response OmpR family regulator